MRHLDLDEISDIVSRYSSDILYSDINHLEVKINQFLNFLFDQPITNRTLKRIDEDFGNLKTKIDQYKNLRRGENKRVDIINSLTTRELQGAFAYFEIHKKFREEKKYTNHYIELANDWYDPCVLHNDFIIWCPKFGTALS